jgi:lysozyme
MKTSERGIELIKSMEGCRLKAYPDPGSGNEPWTIGYGCTHNVHRGMTITQEDAEAMLRQELRVYEAAVEHALHVSVKQHQFDALVSLCWNVGPRNLLGSTVLRKANENDHKAAADAFLLWNKAAGKVMPGLVKRRKAERVMYLGGDDA